MERLGVIGKIEFVDKDSFQIYYKVYSLITLDKNLFRVATYLSEF